MGRLVTVVAVVLIALCACSSAGSTAPPVDSTLSPGAAATVAAPSSVIGQSATCAALSAAVASAAVGTSLTASAPDTSTGGGQSNCTYTAASGQTFRIYLAVGSDANAQFDAMRSGVTDPVDVSGTGAKAFTSGQGVGLLTGDAFVSVIGQVPGDDDGYSLKLKVAQAMLDALGS